LPNQPSPLFTARHRGKAIAVRNQIIGGLLDLTGRQQGLGSRDWHVVYRGEGAIEGTAGQQDSCRSHNKTCGYNTRDGSISRHCCPPKASSSRRRRGVAANDLDLDHGQVMLAVLISLHTFCRTEAQPPVAVER
jgi:hypothetical protein